MPKCNRCGSSDVVEHKGELRCSVCDTVIPVRHPESHIYDKASGGFIVDNPTKRESASATPPLTVGNLLPAWVKVVCVDINPSTVIKLSDRGSFQTAGLITDVEPFLRALVDEVKNLESTPVADQ